MLPEGLAASGLALFAAFCLGTDRNSPPPLVAAVELPDLLDCEATGCNTASLHSQVVICLQTAAGWCAFKQLPAELVSA